MLHDWDTPQPAVLMIDTPELISMGMHTMDAGFSFIWVERRYPCFLSEDGSIIIIFDIECKIPVYDLLFEESDEMLGSFEFRLNCFLERCGIWIRLFSVCWSVIKSPQGDSQ